MKRNLLFYCLLIVASLFVVKQVDAQSLTKGYYYIKSAYDYAPDNVCVYDPQTTEYAKIHACGQSKADIFYIDEVADGQYTVKNAATGRYIIKFISTNSVLLSAELEDGVYIVIDYVDGIYRWKDNTQTCYYNWNGDGVNCGAGLNSKYNYHDWTFESVPSSVLENLGLSGDPVDPVEPVDPVDPDYTEDEVPVVPDQIVPAGYYHVYSAYNSGDRQKNAILYDNGTDDALKVHDADKSKNDVFFIYPKADGQYVMKNLATGRYVIKYESQNVIKLDKTLEEGTYIEFALLDDYNFRFKDNHTDNYYNWNGTNVDNLELSDTYNYHDWKLVPATKAEMASFGITIDTLPKLPAAPVEDKETVSNGFYYIRSAYNSPYVGSDEVVYDSGDEDCLKIHSNGYEKKDIFLIKQTGTKQYSAQNLGTGRYIVKFESSNGVVLADQPEDGTYLVFDLVQGSVYRWKDNHQSCYYNWNGANVNCGAGLSSQYNYHDWELVPVSSDMLEAFGIKGDSIPDDIVPPKDSVAYIDASWESLGTSITWYNNNVSSAFTKGYQTRVREVLPFKKFFNKGVNAGCIAGCPGQVTYANYYTIEHGINDWGHSTPVGTMDDYINNTKNGSFAASYRELLDKIYATNPNAMVVLCTPRKGYGFGGYLPDNCNDALNGIYLKDYAEIIRQIAEYESIPVADFFALCGNQRNLAELSIDKALHPNDNGYQLMADVLVKAMRKVLVHKIVNPVAEDDF